MIVPEISKEVDSLMATKIKTYRAATNRSSSIGDCCMRRLVYLRTMGDKAKPHDVSLQYIFEMGNVLERPVIRWLEDAGYEVSQQQRDFAYPDKGEALVTGHIDCILERDGQRWVTDIKTTSPFVWQKLQTGIVSRYPFSEFGVGAWMGKYPAQLQLYMFGLEIPQGLFIFVNKTSGQIKTIGMELDYGYVEGILKKAASVNDHVKKDTMPDYPDDTTACNDCPFFEICRPPTIGKEYDFINDSEIIAKVERLHELKDMSKEFSEIDSELKEILRGKENIIIGNKYCYQGKFIMVNRKAQEAKAAETVEQWRGKFLKFGD
jgi:CRISPR/Cas system-associated exonuclease Cas4 (RecB family)